jgi:hypothetical protein
MGEAHVGQLPEHLDHLLEQVASLVWAGTKLRQPWRSDAVR